MSRLQELGMRLGLPCNFQDDFVETVVIPLRNESEEVYLPVHCSSGSTGRPWTGPRSRRAYYEFVDRLYQACEGSLHLNFVANLEMAPLDRLRLVDDCLELADRYPGSTFSLRSLEVAENLKAAQPGLEVGPSTFSEVDSVLKARYWMDFAGSSVMTVSREINRRPDLLARIKALGVRVKVVARDFCIPQCPWRCEHLGAIAIHDGAAAASPVEIPAAMAECRRQAMSLKTGRVQAYLPALITLLPGHLPHLAGIVDIVKIEGRALSSKRIRQEADDFLRAESLTSSSNPAFSEPPEAWDRIAGCDRDCEPCGWCVRNIRLHTISGETTTTGPNALPGPALWWLDGEAGSIRFIVESRRPEGIYFRQTARLGIAYRGDDVGPDLLAMVDRFSRTLGELDVATEESPELWPDWQGLHESLALRNLRIKKAGQE